MGGLAINFNANLSNTLVAGNTVIAGTAKSGGSPGVASGPDVSGTIASSNHDLIGNASGSKGFSTSDGDLLNVNPDLGPLQNNGGPTHTMALLTGSPAIDAGDTNAVPSATDQRGYARIVGKAIDIGAYEYGATPATTDLSVTGTAPAVANAGDQITVNLTLTNSSSTAQSNVTLTDLLPTNTTLVSWTPADGWNSSVPAVGSSGTASAWIASLAGNISATFQLVLQINSKTAPGTLLTNTASVGPLTGDPNPANNSSATVTATPMAPTITTQPTDQTVTAGGTATFTAVAKGIPTPTVRWQLSTDGGSTWSNINNATSTTLTLGNVTASMNGNQYRAAFTNSVSTINSNVATLSVWTVPVVTAQPTDQTVTTSFAATFTAAASGNPNPGTQWQVSSDGGSTWSNINDATSTALTLPNVTTSINGNEYRAVFTNIAGKAITSAATLSVNYATIIDLGKLLGGKDSQALAINSSGQVVGNWDTSTGGEYGFLYSNRTITNLGTIPGDTTSTAGAINASGQVVGDSSGSAEHAFLYNKGQMINLGTLPGGDQSFANGINDSGQVVGGSGTSSTGWHAFLDSNSQMTDLNTLIPPNSGWVLNIANAINDSDQIVGYGTINGQQHAFLLDLNNASAPVATTNPSNQSVTAGQTATFTAAASGTPTPTVQWLVSTDGGKTFTQLSNDTNVSGATTSTLTLSNITTAMSGYEYRAVFTNVAGVAITSAATLTVSASNSTTLTPGNPTVTFNTSGLSVPVSATVTNANGVVNQGTVTFMVVPNGTSAGIVQFSAVGSVQAPVLNGQASATLNLANLSAGTYTITENYHDNTGNFTDSSGDGKLTVNPAATSISVNNIVVTSTSSSVQLSASITSSGGVINQGTLTFSLVAFGTTVASVNASVANGHVTASLTLPNLSGLLVKTDAISGVSPMSLPTGLFTIKESYHDSTGDFSDSSGSSQLTVNSAPISTSLIVGNATLPFNASGLSAPISATVTGSSGVNQGTVTFTVLNNGRAVASAQSSVVNGQASATLHVPSLPAGNYTITASYHDSNGGFSDSSGNGNLTIESPPHLPPPPPPPPSPPPSPPPPPPQVYQPPTLNVPPLLAFFDSLLHGVETYNPYVSETITDSFFGFPLLVSTFDPSGNLESVLFFGIDVTALFELF